MTDRCGSALEGWGMVKASQSLNIVQKEVFGRKVDFLKNIDSLAQVFIKDTSPILRLIEAVSKAESL